MRENKKILTVMVAVFLAVAIALSVVACGGKSSGGTGTNGGNKTPTNNTKPPSWYTEGYTIGETTIEDAVTDLVGGLLNLASSASRDTLSNKQPLVSWYVEGDMDLNGTKSDITFGINYDVRDEASLAMTAQVVSKDAENGSDVNLYFYSDNKDEGTFYVKINEQKIAVPIRNTSVASVFPLPSLSGLADTIAPLLSGSIYTEENIKYEYADNSTGKRTRRYIVKVDIKQTLVNIMEKLKNGGNSTKEYYDSASMLIKMIFGIEANKINSQLPASSLVLDYSIRDGLRDKTGKGKMSSLKVAITVAENSNKDTLFKGEKFEGEINFTKLETKAKLLDDDIVPVKNSAYFADFYTYDKSAVGFTGKAYYNADPSTVYNMTIAFLYDGFGTDKNGDKLKFVLEDSENPDIKAFELYYIDGMAYMSLNNKEIEHTFNMDFDELLSALIEKFDAKPTDNALQSIAYYISVINFGDGYLGFKFNKNFFDVILSIDLDEFCDILQQTYVSAGGTGNLIQIMANKGLDIKALIVSNALTAQFDIGHNFVADDVSVPEF